MGKAYYGSRISPNMTKTPEGMLICHNVPIARTGWQEYLGEELQLKDKDKVRVYRDEDEVFAPATIASFEGKPVTNEHPSQWIDVNNIKQYMLGHSQNVRRGDGNETDLLLADLFITDPSLISMIESDQKREVSCGYECDYTEVEDNCTSQQQIRGNHIAIVSKGRAGNRVAIKDQDFTKGGTKGMAKQKVTKTFLQAIGLKAYLKDAEPEEVESVMESMKENDEDPDYGTPPAGGSSEANEGSSNEMLERIMGALEQVMDRLEALEASDKEVHNEMDSLDELEKDLTEDGTEETEEAVTIEPDKIENVDEFAPELANGVVTDPSDRPKNPIPNADSALGMLRTMKPIIAAIGDPIERKRASDALAASLGQYVPAKQKKAGAFGDMNNGVEGAVRRQSRDAEAKQQQNDKDLGKDIAKKYNPHYKEVK